MAARSSSVARAGLQRGGERVAEGARVAVGVGAVGEAEARLRVERVLRRAPSRARVGGGARVARAREDVGDARRDLLAVGAALLQPLELGDRRLVVVPRERALEVHLGVGVELLDARGDLVGLRGGALLVERLEVRVRARPRRRGSAARGRRARASGRRANRACRRRARAARAPRAPSARRRRACAAAPPPRPARAARRRRVSSAAARARARVPRQRPRRGSARARGSRASCRAARDRSRRRACDASCSASRAGVLRLDERLDERRRRRRRAARRAPRTRPAQRRTGDPASDGVAAAPPRGRSPSSGFGSASTSGRLDRVGRPRVAVGLDARGRAVRVQQAHARGGRQHAREHAVPALGHAHVRPEALPRPPLLDVAREDGRVVDPHLDGALHGDDELAVAARREERLGVEDAVLHLLVGRGEAAVLRRRQHVRDAPAHRIRGPRDRPRRVLLRRGSDAAGPVALPCPKGPARRTPRAQPMRRTTSASYASPVRSARRRPRPPASPRARRPRASPTCPGRARTLSKTSRCCRVEVRHRRRAAPSRCRAANQPTSGARSSPVSTAAPQRGDVALGRRARVAVRLVHHRPREAGPHAGVRRRVEPLARRAAACSAVPPGASISASAHRPTTSPSLEPRALDRSSASDGRGHASRHRPRRTPDGDRHDARDRQHAGERPHLNATVARWPSALSTCSHHARKAGYSLAVMRVFASVTVVFTCSVAPLGSTSTSYEPNGPVPFDACGVRRHLRARRQAAPSSRPPASTARRGARRACATRAARSPAPCAPCARAGTIMPSPSARANCGTLPCTRKVTFCSTSSRLPASMAVHLAAGEDRREHLLHALLARRVRVEAHPPLARLDAAHVGAPVELRARRRRRASRRPCARSRCRPPAGPAGARASRCPR